MSSRMRYPQMAELKIGQSAFLPATTAEEVHAIRMAASNYTLRHGAKFSVHKLRGVDAGLVEVARISAGSTGPQIIGEVRPSIVRTR